VKRKTPGLVHETQLMLGGESLKHPVWSSALEPPCLGFLKLSDSTFGGLKAHLCFKELKNFSVCHVLSWTKKLYATLKKRRKKKTQVH